MRVKPVTYGFLIRKFRETIKSMFEESRIMRTIDLFRDSLWPGGQLKPHSVPRSPDEKSRTRDEANRKLSALVPGMQQTASLCH